MIERLVPSLFVSVAVTRGLVRFRLSGSRGLGKIEVILLNVQLKGKKDASICVLFCFLAKCGSVEACDTIKVLYHMSIIHEARHPCSLTFIRIFFRLTCVIIANATVRVIHGSMNFIATLVP